MKTKNITLIGFLLSLSLILGYLEYLFFPDFGVPGVKLGLSNLTVLVSLYILDFKKTIFLGTIKTIISAFLFSGITGLIYGFTGIIFSLIIMLLIYKSTKFSIIGVSISGAVFHNIGQLLAASLISKSIALIYYAPVLLIAGIACGLAIGISGQIIISILKKSQFF